MQVFFILFYLYGGLNAANNSMTSQPQAQNNDVMMVGPYVHFNGLAPVNQISFGNKSVFECG